MKIMNRWQDTAAFEKRTQDSIIKLACWKLKMEKNTRGVLPTAVGRRPHDTYHSVLYPSNRPIIEMSSL